MEKEKTGINYGDGFINVYLPREDGFHVGEVVAPSPIFTLDTIYKFSDQVLNDRHLFLGKKKIHHTHFDSDDADSGRLNSGRSSSFGDRDGNMKTVKLSLDASQQGNHVGNRRRFNERLSAYVSSNRRNSETVRFKQYSRSATTQGSVRPVNIDKTQKSLLSPVLRIGKPGTAPAVEKALNSENFGLPPLQSHRTSLTRQKSYFGKEDTFWFPSSALRGIEHKPHKLGHIPVRPSSRQFKIWRQSTQLLLESPVDSRINASRMSVTPIRMSWPNYPPSDVMVTPANF